jgi:hypothetical protein
MATVTAARGAAAVQPFKCSIAGVLLAAYGYYSFAANPTAADIYKMCRLPARSLVLGGEFSMFNTDTSGATIDIDLGWLDNGDGSATYTASDGTIYTNTASSTSSTGFLDIGVMNATAVTNVLATGANWRPIPLLTGPLFFTQETDIIATIVAAANTFAAGAMTCVLRYIDMG